MFYPDNRSPFDIGDLAGEIITSIEGVRTGSAEVTLNLKSGKQIAFYHHQDCCESVRLYDFETDTSDFSGALITSAEETRNDAGDEVGKWGTGTWTFYKIETSKGGIWMRWLGESNGYYSESVDVVWVNKGD